MMGLNKGPFVVVDTVSVDDPFDANDPDVIVLSNDGDSAIVATVDVCVKQPQKTQVCIDSMLQMGAQSTVVTNEFFKATYEIVRNNDTVLATIDDEMDYIATGNPVSGGRHTNFPNFPLVDNNPICGINTYDLIFTRVMTQAFGSLIFFIGSRSLKATVITL